MKVDDGYTTAGAVTLRKIRICCSGSNFSIFPVWFGKISSLTGLRLVPNIYEAIIVNHLFLQGFLPLILARLESGGPRLNSLMLQFKVRVDQSNSGVYTSTRVHHFARLLRSTVFYFISVARNDIKFLTFCTMF